jgi:hypothetical protein
MEGPPRPAEAPEDEDEGLLPKKGKDRPGEGFIKRVIEGAREADAPDTYNAKDAEPREWPRKVVLPGVVSKEDGGSEETAEREVKNRTLGATGPETDTLIINRESEHRGEGRINSPRPEEITREGRSANERREHEKKLPEEEIAFDKRHEIKNKKAAKAEPVVSAHRPEPPQSEIHHISEVIKNKTKDISDFASQGDKTATEERAAGIQKRMHRTGLLPYGKAVYIGFISAVLILLLALIIYLTI